MKSTEQTTFKNIDEYITHCPAEVQESLENLRMTIRAAAPQAKEAISYQMPTFKQYGNLVHFAVHKNHIGFYPAPSGIEQYKNELAPYKFSRGAVQFPLDKPIPFDLVSKIVAFRVAENFARAEEKTKQKK
jgi:uncharacterized protein YdhG (YjbR/CyaY superfamily)